MVCTACGTENPPGNKFCAECGVPLERACPVCGTPVVGSPKFCGNCGAPLGVATIADAGTPTQPSTAFEQPAERRLVSVLFADLVGFTTLSEARDAEEVRDLLSRYFDVCRTLIARYGGTVEKFIGDAVMAVWGTPVAKEDDAERAVRAALDLTAAVTALGDDVGEPNLRARAGVLTGEAAVMPGGGTEGMVAGDLVNTASRIQSAAEPGAVLVGEATRRASQAAIAYQDAGMHELKGKAEPVPLWRAERVLAGVGGAQKSQGLETPFVGRDRELRLIKEVFHASAEEHKPHLVSVVGIAGTGKSRLSWEFFKYIDGLAGNVRWHRGRCLAYGEGVSYWALAEMVRTRAEIVEGEEPFSAATKLRRAVEETLPDPEERRWVEPRLANLLGLDDHGDGDQESLFAAWRLFYERLADEMPTVMVFEDMQWADAGLLDFVDYLLEWSRDHSLFVITLARPELLDRRANWGSSGRSFTSLHLEALPKQAMEQLLTSVVPGLSEELRAQILDRAEGVPLYAVETLRMLLDRGLLVQEDSRYRLTETVETLEIPETLHALIAARLDGLSPQERRLVQDASVLGKTFTRDAIADLTGLTSEELDPLLTSLGRKEVLTVLADRFSPERGQYGFLQELVKRVAYETLAKKERKTRHLAAARFIEEAWRPDEEEFVEVAASHLLEAHRLAPDADDAAEIRSRAGAMLVRAGERAASVAANAEARRYFDDAADLSEDPVITAELLERAGIAARATGDADTATERFQRAVKLFEAAGHPHPAARVSARMAELMWDRGRFADAVSDMDRSYQVLSSGGLNEDLAVLAAQLGRFLFFAGKTDVALERIESAIDAAEHLFLPDVLSNALNTKAVIYYSTMGRRREGFALLKYALELAIENDDVSAALRAYYNLADLADQSDRYQEARDYVDEALTLARRIGNRAWEWQLAGQLYPLYALGEWDELLARTSELPRERIVDNRAAFNSFMLVVPLVHIARGDVEAAENAAAVFPDASGSDDVQEASMWYAGKAALSIAGGEQAEAYESSQHSLRHVHEIGLGAEAAKEGLVAGLEAAWLLGDVAKVEELLGMIDTTPRGVLPQYVDAHGRRFHARLAERRGDLATAEERLKGAAGLFRELEVPFWAAVSQLELAERLTSWGRPDDAGPIAADARAAFERLKAVPWLERVDRLSAMESGRP